MDIIAKIEKLKSDVVGQITNLHNIQWLHNQQSLL